MTGKTLDRRLAGEPPGFNVEELDRIAAVTGVPIESFLVTAVA